MDVPAYTIVVVCMGALSAAAAIGAVALALGQLKPGRRTVRRHRRSDHPMVFDPAPEAEALPEAEPDPEPPPVELAAPEPEPAPPEPAPLEPPIVREPVRRLELALMSRRAPERLRVPVGLPRGRILELNLPLLLSNSGEADLQAVTVEITLPNEITYGASLERLGDEGVAGAPGAVARYTLSEHETTIHIELPRLAPGVTISVPVPVSIKRAAHAAYPILAVAAAADLEPVERRYALELVDPAAEAAPADAPDAWICRPDETRRQRHPHLPLDRICSMEFDVSEPKAPETMPPPALAQAAYAALSL